jgi:hypothetical protein
VADAFLFEHLLEFLVRHILLEVTAAADVLTCDVDVGDSRLTRESLEIVLELLPVWHQVQLDNREINLTLLEQILGLIAERAV